MEPCPFCGYIKLSKDGYYPTAEGKKQRYRCHRCGRRFSKATITLLKSIAKLPLQKHWERTPEAPKKPEAEARLEARTTL